MKKVEEINTNSNMSSKGERRYSKDAVLKSNKFVDFRDVLFTKLQEDRTYTMQELENIVKKFEKPK